MNLVQLVMVCIILSFYLDAGGTKTDTLTYSERL